MKDTDKHKSLCGAKMRSGTPCAKYPLKGKRRYRLHGSLASGPKTLKGKERVAAGLDQGLRGQKSCHGE